MKNGGIEIQVAEDMRCCNSCYARNYDEDGQTIGKRVDRIIRIQAGRTVIALCDECVKEMIQSLEELIEK